MRIGVILPQPYSGGTMRGALSAAIQLHDGAKQVGDDAIIEFGYVDGGQEDCHSSFESLVERGIAFRPIKIERHHPRSLAVTSVFQPSVDDYIVFNDGVSNFDDCDFLLIVSDRLTDGVVAPTYRYGIIVYDFIQRYVPTIFEAENEDVTSGTWRIGTGMFRNFENASAVFTSTEQAASDAICYGGVSPERLFRIPLEFEIFDESPTLGERPREEYILWTTNATPHKNHLRAMEALDLIYSENDAFPKVMVTGVLTELFDPSLKDHPLFKYEYIRQVRSRIIQSKSLSEKLVFLGNLPDDRFVSVLKSAALLFHPATFDNGTYSVIEAAWQGVPSVSSNYAAMHEISRYFELPLTYFESSSAKDMALKLMDAFDRRNDLVAQLPTRAHLARFSREKTAQSYWRAVRDAFERVAPERSTFVGT